MLYRIAVLKGATKSWWEIIFVSAAKTGENTWAQIQVQFPKLLNPLCSCGLSIESTSHFLLHCPIFHDKRHTLLSTLNNIDSKILESNDSYLTQTLLFGSTSFNSETNTLDLNATIDYILSTEIFEEPIF